jgi:4-hydroxy-3-methylbut-2-enyl diphosphate reductase
VERIAIFAALQWECRPVLRTLRQVRRVRFGAFTGWQGRSAQREVWMVKTGVGVRRAAAAVDAAGGAQGFALVVSTGCAGGLSPDLRPGDLTLATAVSGDGTESPLTTAAVERARALQAATAAGLRTIEGPLLCSATVLATMADKRAAAACGAVVVEMEGGAIAARAAAAQVPFLSVRAILDAVDHELHVPGSLIDPVSGAMRPLAVARYVVTHPGTIAELTALQRMQRAARVSLERFFARWLAAN